MTVHDLGYVVSPDGYQYLAQDFLGLSPHVEIRLVQRNIDNQIYQIVNTPDGIEVFRYVSTKCRQIFYLSDNPLILLPKLLYIFQSSLNKTN